MILYEDYINSNAWKRKREEILNRDKHTCQICGKKYGTMNVHHIAYEDHIEETREYDIITLCPNCHKLVHNIQKQMDDYSEMEMKLLKEKWANKMADIINKTFTNGICGKSKSRTLRIIRDTFYRQKNHLWAICPDFITLQKLVKTRK